MNALGPRRYTSGGWFCELELVDLSVTVRSGVGMLTKTRTWSFRSSAGAVHEYHRRARDLEAEGFELDSGDTPARAPSTPRRKEVAEREREILANVDDDAAFAVYGDWLAERGDPRGELISLHARGATKRAASFLKQHPELWGGLADLVGDVVTRAVWRLGFLDAVDIGNTNARISGCAQLSMADVLRKLFEGPGRFLRTLSVGLGTVGAWDGGRRVWYDDEVAAITEFVRPTLRHLAIGAVTWEEGSMDETRMGDVASLSEALPQLQRLILRAGYLDMRGARFSEVRELSLATASLTPRLMNPLDARSFPKLEKLALAFLPGRTVTIKESGRDALEIMLSCVPQESMWALGLRNFEAHHIALPLLLDSTLAAQLRELDLSDGTLDDPTAGILIRRRAALPQLERLVVTGNLLTDAGLAALRNASFDVVSEPSRRSPNGQRVFSTRAAALRP